MCSTVACFTAPTTVSESITAKHYKKHFCGQPVKKKICVQVAACIMLEPSHLLDGQKDPAINANVTLYLHGVQT